MAGTTGVASGGRTEATRTAPESGRVGAPARSPRPTSHRAGAFPYRPGLDGLRALAVTAVVIYHLSPSFLPGGFFGVDLFFVISGYLITSMLAEEWSERGSIKLRQFWMRRIRRLYPAIIALLVVLIVVGSIFAPDAVVPMRETIPAALVYLTNWWYIYHHVPYFQATGRPPVLLHFWSLAIEEQYYLVWPPVLLLLLRHWRKGRIAALALVLAVVSCVLMGVLYGSGGDLNRIYYGSDTHAQGLLLGSALGLVVPPAKLSAGVQVAARKVLDATGIIAIAGLVALMFALSYTSSVTWRGGLAAVVLLAGVAVVVASHPGSRLSSWLGTPPLRWLGTRSYSIYLWHWPIIDLTRPQDVGFGGPRLLVFRLILIVVASEGSYRLVEQPWRTRAAQRWLRRIWADRRRRHYSVGGAVAAVAILVALLSTATMPAPPGALRLGATAAAKSKIVPVLPTNPKTTTHGHAKGSTPPTTTPAGQKSHRVIPGLTPGAATPPSTPPTTAAYQGQPPALVKAPPGGPVLAIGDSVMLAASPDLEAAFGHSIVVDAAVGRQVATGLARLQEYKAAGRLKGLRALIVGLGSNGAFTPADMQQFLQLAQGIPRVILLNVRVPDAWGAESNRTIESVAHRPGFTVIDWYAVSADSAILWPDGIHPNPVGQAIYSNLVVKAVTGR